MKRYRNARGHFVSKEVWDYIQREKKGQKQQRKAKPKEIAKQLAKKWYQYKKRKRKKNKKYPPELVGNEITKNRGRKQLAKWKQKVEGGRAEGLRWNKEYRRRIKLGYIPQPMLTEKTPVYTSYVWVFEDSVEGEQLVLEVLDAFRAHPRAKEIRAIVAIEVRNYTFVERIGSPWGTPDTIATWVVGWQHRPSGKPIFEAYKAGEDFGARLIWELEIMVPVGLKLPKRIPVNPGVKAT